MLAGCHNCLFISDELMDWYGCIFGDGTGGYGCGNWIPNDEAMAQIQEERRSWRSIYEKRKQYNREVPEEERVVVNREGLVVR